MPPRTRARRRHRRPALLGLVVVAGLLVGCAAQEPVADGPDGASPDPVAEADEVTGATEPAAPEASTGDTGESDPAAVDRHLIAEAAVPTVTVRDAPGGDEIHALDHPREVGAPLTFLVDGRQSDEDGSDWLEVLLPVRPNGSTGWIRADDVSLTSTPYRVEVMLSEHRLVVYDGDDVRLDAPIGVGGDGAPTPPGRYFVTELLRPPDPTGPYGPYAFGLSGFSEVHLDFAGGEGVIGIHGTNDPSSIGRDSSQGCIRLPNEVVEELATFLPLGAPVTIHT